jgi:hypothetical protein
MGCCFPLNFCCDNRVRQQVRQRVLGRLKTAVFLLFQDGLFELSEAPEGGGEGGGAIWML